jgi:hypothetical protein
MFSLLKSHPISQTTNPLWSLSACVFMGRDYNANEGYDG